VTQGVGRADPGRLLARLRTLHCGWRFSLSLLRRPVGST